MGEIMKSILKCLAVVIFLTSLSHTVFADESSDKKNWYGKFGIGYVEQINDYNEVNIGRTKWDFDSGHNFSISAGYADNYWALEGELAYRSMDMDSRILKSDGSRDDYIGDQTQIALMLNGYLYPQLNWLISPYVGIGFGATKISWNDIKVSGSNSKLDDSDTVFTRQFIVGASYKITPHIILEADYRYYVPDAVEIVESSSGVVGKLDNQELNIIGIFIKYKI